jgi:hypothetical protein
MLKRTLLLVCLVPLIAGCPHNGPGPVISPYTTARAAIQTAQIALSMADGVFEIWAGTQTDLLAVEAARAKYLKVRTAVADGLKVAMDAVALAEAVGVDLDLGKVLAAAEAAWQDLRKFLSDLGTTPASKPMLKGTFKMPVEKLPPSLLPVPPAKR